MSDNPLLAGQPAGGNPLLSGAMPPPAPEPKLAPKKILQPKPSLMSDEGSPRLFGVSANDALDFISKAPQLLESTKDMPFISRIASPLAKVFTAPVTFPAQFAQDVSEGTRENLQSGLPLETALPAAILGTAKKQVLDPADELTQKADDLELKAAANPLLAPQLLAGAKNLRRLSIVPFAGPAIAQDAEKYAQGDKAGAVTDVGAQALMLGLGSQGKEAVDTRASAAKARAAAINDLADAHLQAATNNGKAFDRTAVVNAVKDVPTQDIIDSANAQKNINQSKAKMAKPQPEVAPTDIQPEEVRPEIKAKVPESKPAVPAEDLKSLEKQAAKVKQPDVQVPGPPAEGGAAPALIDDAERGKLEAAGFTIDSQGRLARIIQPREANLDAGQAAIEAETPQKTPVFAPETPGPKGLLPAAPDTVPGNNPTPTDIAALKAKNGITDVPSEKVGAPKTGMTAPAAGTGLKTNLLKNRTSGEKGAVRPDLLVGAPAEVAAEVGKKVAEVAGGGRGIGAAAAQAKTSSNEPLPKYAGSINLERLATPDDVKRSILDNYNANKETIDKARKPGTTFEDTKKAALELGWDADKTVKGLKNGKIDATRIQAARQATLGVNEEVSTLKKAYEQDPSPKNLIAVQEALSRSAAINQAMQGASAEAGRALNAHKIMAEALRESQTNVQKAMELVKRQLGDKWEEAQQAVIEALSQIPEGDNQRLNQFIRGYAQFTTKDKVYAYYVSNLLSGIQTNVKNHFLSRISQLPLEAVNKTVRGVLDPVLAKAQGREREFYGREGAASLSGAMQGARSGFESAMQIIKNGMTDQKAAELQIPKHFQFTGWAKAWNYPGRLAEASVALFKSMGVSGELNAQAVRQGLKEGLSGKALDKRVGELLSNPSEQMLKAADDQAKKLTFTDDPGTWTKAFIDFRNRVAPVKYAAPFVNIPTNIMKAGFEFSPFGYLKLPREVGMGLLTKDAKRTNYWKSPEAADAFSRATIGTAIALFAANKYENGELTGAAPSTSAERDQFLRQHPEYSVKVNGRWLKYTDFGPLMVSFMTAAALKDAQQTHKNFDDSAVAFQAIGTLAHGILQQSFYKGLNDMANTFGGSMEGTSGAVSRTGAGYASGFVPFSGLLHSTRNIVDSKLRDPDGIYERIKNGIPWLSDTVPSRLNALGNETQGSMMSGILGLGLRSSQIDDVDIEKELARTGVAPSLPPSALNISSHVYDLTRDQKRELTGILGDARKQVLRQLFTDQFQVTLGKGSDRETLNYSQMDDEQKAKAIRKSLEDAYQNARDQFVSGLNARNETVTEKPKKAKLMFVGEQ